MQRKKNTERQLCKAIDLLVEEIQERYNTEVSDEQEIDRKMKNIELRDSLIEQITEEIRCRKISEKALHEANVNITYELIAEIANDRLHYNIKHKTISRATE